MGIRLIDYRDHPEFYQPGWYPMQSPDALIAALPPTARLILGKVSDTIPSFIEGINSDSPLAFVSIDLDYYSSTVDAFPLFEGTPEKYLPEVEVYLDDVQNPEHCEWAGELLAVHEFNRAQGMRKIGPANFLREQRLFKNASWISHMYRMHVFDHPQRHTVLREYGKVVLGNPYLNISTRDGDK